MSTINNIIKQIVTFRDARDWKQFHNPKDVSLSMMLEAAEVLEHFQWKNEKEMKEYVKTHKNAIGKELADVFYWVLLLSHDLGINISEAFKNKMVENSKKYPVSKSKGKHLKYKDL